MNALEDVMLELSSLGALASVAGPTPLGDVPPEPVVTEIAAPSPPPRAQALAEQLQEWEATISDLGDALSRGLAQIARAQEMISKARILEQSIRSIK